MRVSTCLILGVLFGVLMLAPHARPADHDVLAALALAAAKPEAARPFVPEPVKSPARLDKNDYGACLQESLRTGRHLALWVGYACISSERQLPDLIHCHVDEGTIPGVRGQAVLVGVPRNGVLVEQARIPVDEVCALTIKQGCANTYKKGTTSPAMVRASGG